MVLLVTARKTVLGAYVGDVTTKMSPAIKQLRNIYLRDAIRFFSWKVPAHGHLFSVSADWKFWNARLWVHHVSLVKKGHSMKWEHSSSSISLKLKVQKSAKYLMTTVFWKAKDVLQVDFLAENQFKQSQIL